MKTKLPNFKDSQGRTLVPVGEAAQILGISIDTLRRWDEKGKIISKRPDGKNRYFLLDDLQNLKNTKKLSISETSELLGISQTTLRRLDQKGLVVPQREKGERVYDIAELEDFMGSQYLQTKKHIQKAEVKELENLERHIEEKENAQFNQITAALEQEDEEIHQLFDFRKRALQAAVLCILISFVLVSGFTFAYLKYPDNTAKFMGYMDSTGNKLFESPNIAPASPSRSQGGPVDESGFDDSISQVLGAASDGVGSGVENLIRTFLSPFSKASLAIVQKLSPGTYEKVVPRDINDYFAIDKNGSMSIGPVKNLNAKFLRGKFPGIHIGNIAYFSEEGVIAGLNLGGSITTIFDAVDLASTDVTGLLSLSNGGTGADLSSAAKGGLVFMAEGKLSVTDKLTGVLLGNGSNPPDSVTGTGNYIVRWGVGGDTLTSESSIFDNGNVGIATTDPGAKLDIAGTLRSSSTVTFSVFTSNGGPLYTNGSGTLAQTTAGTSSQCLIGGTTPTFGSCFTGGTGSAFWNQTNGTIYPNNSTVDLLIGGQSTASAKFAVLNVNGTGPVTATVSGNLIVMPTNGAGGNVGIGTITPAAKLDVSAASASIIELARFQNTGSADKSYLSFVRPSDTTRGLVIGHQVTPADSGNYSFISARGGISQNIFITAGLDSGGARGNIVLQENGGVVGIGTITPLTSLHVDGAGSKGRAALIVDQTASSLNDIFTASAAGATRFTLANDGDLTLTGGNVITASSLDTFTTAATLGMASTTTLNLGSNAAINSALTALNLQADGAIDVNIAGGSGLTGCTIANSTGNLTCSGNIAGSSTGIQGYWQRNLGALAPTNITDDLLLGATSTTSAVFAFTGMASPTHQTQASISGNLIVMPNNGFGGNVGIGTTNPTQTLHVAGQCVTGDTLLKRRRRARRRNRHSGEEEDDDSRIDSGRGQNDDDYTYEDVRIDQIKEGDEILTLDEKTGEFVPQKIEKLMDMGMQQTYLLVTATGKTIRTTANHPYLVRDAQSAEVIGGVYQVDQSPKMEQLEKDSFVAVANEHMSFSIKVPSRVKKQMYAQYKAEGRLNLFAPTLFARSLAILIKEAHLNPNRLDIDLEYTGYEQQIRQVLGFSLPDMQIHFQAVGHSASSFAHWAAYRAFEANKKDRGTLRVGLGIVAPVSFNRIRNTRDLVTKPYQKLEGLSRAKWRKVYEIKPGMEVATQDGWEKIVSLKEYAREQTFDIQVANTHNFVGNDIVAHNTYINSTALTANIKGLEITQSGAVTGTGYGLHVEKTGGSTTNVAGYFSASGATTNNYGLIVENGSVGIGTITPTALLDVNGTASIAGALKLYTTPAIQSTANQTLTLGGDTTGNIVLSENTGVTGLLSANGGLTVPSGQTTTFASFTSNGGVFYGNTTGVLQQVTAGTSSQCLIGGTTPTFGSCFSGGSGSAFWNQTLGALSPNNSTVDLLIGGQATTSAKFAVLNMNSGTPTASISGNSGNIATYLTGDGTLATTNRQSLTLGNSATYNTTGNILLNPNGTGNVGIGTTAPLGLLSVSGATTSTQGQALVQINQTSTGPIFTASQGGTTKFVIDNAGNVGIGTTDPQVALSLGSGKALAFQTVDPTYNSGIGAKIRFNEIGSANGDLIFTSSEGGSGTTDALTIYRNGNVGIGTIAPRTRLDVTGSASISANLAFNGSGTTHTVSTFDGGNINFDMVGGGSGAGTSALYLQNTGNVGIGTTAPTALLDVNGTASIAGALKLYTTPTIQSTANQTLTLGGDTTGNIVLSPLNSIAGSRVTPGADNLVSLGSSPSGRFKDIFLGPGSAHIICTTGDGCGQGLDYALGVNTSTGTFSLGVNGTSATGNPLLNITQGGNVGIGTTAPGDKLEVAGGGETKIDLNLVSATTSFIASTWSENGTEKATIQLIGSAFSTADRRGAMEFIGQGKLDFHADAYSATPDMRITGGNVGIGTTNPRTTLDVTGSASISANLAFNGSGTTHTVSTFDGGNINFDMVGGGSGAGTSALYLQNTGNVGIGTTAPGTKLTILSNTGTSGVENTFSITNNVDSNLFMYVSGSSATDKRAIIGPSTATALTFQTSGTEYLRISSAGNVGIGTTAPTALLHVNGGYSNNAALIVNNLNSGDIFTASASGLSKFTIANTGALTSAAYTNAGGILYTATTGIIGQTAIGTSSQCLIGGTIPTFGSCFSGGTGSAFWNQTNGALYPNNSTVDLLIGGQATTSAKFAVLNMNSGTPTASISANSGNIATYLTGDGTLATTNRQSLTLGNSATYNTTGNILLNPNGTGNVGIGTTAPTLGTLQISSTTTSTTTTSQSGFYLGSNFTGTSGTSIGQYISNSANATGTSTASDYGLFVSSAYAQNQTGTGAAQYGIYTEAYNTGGNTLGTAMALRAAVNLSNSSTITNGYALYGNAPSIPAGSILTNAYGLNIASQINTNGASSATGGYNNYGINLSLGNQGGNTSGTDNNYGLYITGNGGTAGGGGTVNNYAIYSNSTAQSYFAGNVGIGTSTPSAKLDVTNATSTNLLTNIQQNISNNAIAISSSYLNNNYLPGMVWYTQDNAPTKPKAGIWVQTTSNGSYLNLGTSNSYGTGITNQAIVIDYNGNVGIGTTAPLTSLHVNGAGSKGRAALIVDQTASSLNDIFTASASGLSKFTISNTGALTDAAYTNAGGILYTATTGIIGQTAVGTASQCLIGGTTPTFGSCFSGGTGSAFWNQTLGALFANNSTVDTLLGGQSSASAAFRVVGQGNPNKGTLVAASVSANTSFAGLVVDQSGVGDIFTASYSGAPRFTIANTGAITQTVNTLTTGIAYSLSSTSNYLTTGGLMALDWSPGAATTSTGDLLSLNVGSNGILGNIFNVKDNGATVFSVSQTAVTSNLPTNFTAPGDVSIAYDINFTNPTASYIKSAAPLYLQAGEVFNSSDLTLSTFNKGNVIVDSEAFVTNYAATISGQLVVGTSTAPANIGAFYLTNSSTFGKALAILNQTENQDIFAASASGVNRFVIQSGGNVGIGTTAPGGKLGIQNGTYGGILVDAYSDGATWAGSYGKIQAGSFAFGGTTTTSLLLNPSGGNVGIGTTAPGFPLDVQAATGKMQIKSTTGANGTWLQFVNNAGTSYIGNQSDVGNEIIATSGLVGSMAILAPGTTRAIQLATNSTARVTILSGGNVGIGTTAPTEKLQIEGGNVLIGQKTNTSAASDQTWTAQSAAAGQIDTGGTSSIASVSAMAVYNGSLYVGTNKTDAAEVYRYDGASGSWTPVSFAAGNIDSGGTATIDMVSAMTVYNGKLYIGTTEANSAQVYVYESGTNWTLVSGTGTFLTTTAIDSVSSMTVSQGRLYIGTTETAKAEVYRYDGRTTWFANNATAGTFITNTVIDGVTSMVSFEGQLYIGTYRGTNSAEFYRLAGEQSWVNMGNGTPGTFGPNTNVNKVNAMAVYAGKLFLGLQDDSGARLYRWGAGGVNANNGTSLEAAAGQLKTGGTSGIDAIKTLAVYNGHLYVGTEEPNGAQIYRFEGNIGEFTLMSQATAGTVAAGGTSGIDQISTMIQYGNDFYAGTYNSAEVYKHTVVLDQSYALQFHAGTSGGGGEQSSLLNIGSIAFTASPSGNLNSTEPNTGSFIFSHSILTNTGAYDLAEDYGTRDDSLEGGDLVSIDPNEKEFVRKSTGAGDNLLIGVYSSDPGFRLSQKDTTINGGRAVPIALAGRVPVKVSSENGSIQPGDYLTSSSVPGVAMKATDRTQVVGQAMEAYSSDDPQAIGRVVVYIAKTFYDPDVYLTDSGNISVMFDPATELGVVINKDKTVDRISAFSESVVGKIRAGIITATTITTDSLNIKTDQVMIGDKTLAQYIAENSSQQLASSNQLVVSSQELEVKISDLQNQVASISAVLGVASPSAELQTLQDTITQKEAELASLSASSQQPVASSSGKFASLRVTGSALIEGITTVLDNMTVQSLIVNSTSTFLGDVVFKGHISLSSDSGGQVVIKKGKDNAAVVFDKEYQAPPLVNATILIDNKALEGDILNSSYDYAVVRRTADGFSIKLNKAAADDVKFSWTAFEEQ